MTRRAAVIGAGLAGAACARRLADAGFAVEVFDDRPAPGGRLATWRAETALGPVAIDHGAQHLSVRSEEFSAKMRRWVAAGVAETWSARLVSIDERGVTRPYSALAWIGRPGMPALVQNELAGLAVRQDARVTALIGEPGLWRLVFEDGAERGFYHVVVAAIPSEGAAELLKDAAPFQASAARRVRAAPCWAAVAVFASPVDAPYDGAHIARGPISWIARDASKPGRGPLETWVIHAAPGWSHEFETLSPDEAAPRLIEAFRRRIKAPEPAWLAANVWRSALVERAVGSPFGWDPGLKIGSCGDWYLGPRAELAWTSGDGLGRAMVEDLAASREDEQPVTTS